jgi:hypothetical protein
MLHCLLAFLQQLQHIAGLVCLGKVDLRFNFLGGFVPGNRAGFRGEILPDLYRFIFFNGA